MRVIRDSNLAGPSAIESSPHSIASLHIKSAASQATKEEGVFRATLKDLAGEEGSISPLIITYFLISLLIVFIGINVTHTYLERRHLILTLEASLQRATQEIDDYRYYTGYVDANTSSFGMRGLTTFVPIDCTAAKKVFDQEFRIQWALTRGNNLPDQSSRDTALLDQSAHLWRSANPTSPYPAHSPQSVGITSILNPPRVSAFHCDGKTLRAEAEQWVELPFVISFAGVDFIKYSRQVESVEVGLILGG